MIKLKPNFFHALQGNIIVPFGVGVGYLLHWTYKNDCTLLSVSYKLTSNFTEL